MELFVIVLLFGFVFAANNDLTRIDLIHHEHECISAGGICTIAADCPDGQLSRSQGLCPKQQKEGIECCYGISVKETRCIKRGGECFSQEMSCNEKLLFKNATDCHHGYKCCILI